MTREREDVVGLDATIIMHPAIWKASGHVDTFADLMRECSLTNKRVRADHVFSGQQGEPRKRQRNGEAIVADASGDDAVHVACNAVDGRTVRANDADQDHRAAAIGRKDFAGDSQRIALRNDVTGIERQ